MCLQKVELAIAHTVDADVNYRRGKRRKRNKEKKAALSRAPLVMRRNGTAREASARGVSAGNANFIFIFIILLCSPLALALLLIVCADR